MPAKPLVIVTKTCSSCLCVQCITLEEQWAQNTCSPKIHQKNDIVTFLFETGKPTIFSHQLSEPEVQKRIYLSTVLPRSQPHTCGFGNLDEWTMALPPGYSHIHGRRVRFQTDIERDAEIAFARRQSSLREEANLAFDRRRSSLREEAEVMFNARRSGMSAHHHDDTPGTYSCTYSSCKEVFFSREQRKSHYRHEHKLTYCARCDTHYPSASACAEHIGREHPNEDLEARLYKCSHCGVIYSAYLRCDCGRNGGPEQGPQGQESARSPRSSRSPRSPLVAEHHRGGTGKDEVKNHIRNGEDRARPSAEEARAAAERAKLRAEILRREVQKDGERYQQEKPRKESDKGPKEGPRRSEHKDNAQPREEKTAGKDRDDKPRTESHKEPRTGDRRPRDNGPSPSDREQAKKKIEKETPPPPDHYAVLEILPTATTAEILKAAKKKRIETHPDKFSGQNLAPSEVDRIVERAKNVGLAADALSDPETKRKYDQKVADWKAKHKKESDDSGAQNTRPPKPKYQPKFNSPLRNEYRDTERTGTTNRGSDEKGGDQGAHTMRTPKPKYEPKFSSPLRNEYRDTERTETTNRGSDRDAEKAERVRLQ